MPIAPPKACPTPGCPGLVPAGKQRCASCERTQTHERNSRPARKLYNSAAWKRIRKAVLIEEPLCRECLGRSVLTPSTDVDHIDGNYKNTARSNLQGLCHTCHSIKTAKENGSFGRA